MLSSSFLYETNWRKVVTCSSQSLGSLWPTVVFIYLFFILLASPTDRDTATACANYCGPGTRSQFCGGRKPEYPEETLEVRLRLTETQSTYNIVVEVEGVTDVHYASLTSLLEHTERLLISLHESSSCLITNVLHFWAPTS